MKAVHTWRRGSRWRLWVNTPHDGLMELQLSWVIVLERWIDDRILIGWSTFIVLIGLIC